MRIPIMENLGEFIAEQREVRGMSREDLAEKAGISAARLKDIEDDSKPPFAWEIWHIAHCLGLTVSELLGDSLDEDPTCHHETDSDNLDLLYYVKGWLPLAVIPQSLEDVCTQVTPKMYRNTQLVEVSVRILGVTDKDMRKALKGED